MSTELKQQIDYLEKIQKKILSVSSLEDKHRVLSEEDNCKTYLKENNEFQKYLQGLSLENLYLIKSVLTLNEGHSIFREIKDSTPDQWSELLQMLKELDRFYDSLGGIIGYHLTVLKCIDTKEKKETSENINYRHPPLRNISSDSKFLREAIQSGIMAMENLVEIYPVGGAGDRLNLHDEKENQALPAAQLLFLGRTLLEGLFRDLQGREYLYYKLYKKQSLTPVAMMTSHEKNNHAHILSICEKNKWFGRPQDSLLFFTQPLVPVMTISGEWVMQGPLKPLLKPGGHGVIWKQALDSGILDYFISKERPEALIRQINNPIAGIDYGLLAFIGIGNKEKKIFGFASCPRLLNATEGMDVLVEKRENQNWNYCITNVEYTSFEAHGLKDEPEKKGSPYSQYPANTNILFVNLSLLKPFIKKHPIPGMIINMKNSVSHVNKKGEKENIPSGRLESTMQNIADTLVTTSDHCLNDDSEEQFKSYITYNNRRKTISVTKKLFTPKDGLLETPEGSFFELMQNYEELLKQHCNVSLPLLNEQNYLKDGPPFVLLFHPALGPIFEVIAQKIQKGSLKYNSHLELEIAELEMKHFTLNGSLIIHASCPLGEERESIIHYGIQSGKCELTNVKVNNKGPDRTSANVYWKNEIAHLEKMEILIHGNGEFVAENVTFNGPFFFEVPAHHRMTVKEVNGKIETHLEPISHPTWCWEYAFDKELKIVLEKQLFHQ